MKKGKTEKRSLYFNGVEVKPGNELVIHVPVSIDPICSGNKGLRLSGQMEMTLTWDGVHLRVED